MSEAQICALFHLSWVDDELRHFMVSIVDEASSRVNLKRSTDDNEYVCIAYIFDGYIHTVNILAKHHNIWT